ncbi:MAG: cyclodeaminase/cyclohydrolase family protein [Bacillota bacterium]
MIKIIYNKTVKKLGEKIAQKKDAVPAGGTTSALNGYLGVSLLELVFNVSKNNFNENNIEEIEKTLKKAKNDFLNLMDKDIEVYKTNSKTHFKVKENLKKLIETPLQIVITSSEIITLTAKFENNVKKTVIADYDIALENLKTAKKGAKIIIQSNYQFFDENSKFIKNIKRKLENLC